MKSHPIGHCIPIELIERAESRSTVAQTYGVTCAAVGSTAPLQGGIA